MPNHITNIVTVESDNPDTVHAVLSSLVSNEGLIDFAQLLPRPKSEDDNWYHWNIEHWGTKWNAYSYFFEGHNHPECKRWHYSQKLGKPLFLGTYKPTCYLDRIRKKAFKRWLASHQLDELRFDTAWGAPFQVIQVLSVCHPDVVIDLTYADEDVGSNCGTVKFKAGRVISEHCAPSWSSSTQEEQISWLRFAMSIKAYSEDDMREVFHDLELPYEPAH